MTSDFMNTDQYRRIIFQAPYGYVYGRVVPGEANGQWSVELLEMNPAYERMSGLSAVGDMKHRLPGGALAALRDHLAFGRCEAVASSGGEEAFSHYVLSCKKWFTVSVWSPCPSQFMATYTPVEEPAELQEQEAPPGTAAKSKPPRSMDDAMAALRESEEKYRTLFAHSPMGIVHFGTDSTILDANIEFVKVIGSSREALIGFNIFERVKDEPMIMAIRDALSGRTGHYEGVYRSVTAEKATYVRGMFVSFPGDDGRIIGGVGIFEDITESKEATEALELTRQSYFDIFNSVSEAIYVQDETGIFIDVNIGAEKMYGYSQMELIGQSPITVAAPGLNDLDHIWKMEMEVFTTGVPAAFDFWAVRKNGEIFPKEVIVNRGRYFGQDVLIAMARDITEKKNAERSLRQSLARNKAFLFAIPDLLFVFSRNGDYIDAFTEDDTKLIAPRQALIGKNLSDLFSPEITGKALEAFSRSLDRNELVEFSYSVNTGGLPEYYETRVVPLSENNVLTLVRDITQRVLSEEALRESEQKFRLITENISDGILILGADNRIQYASPSYVRQFGYAAEEEMSRGPEEIYSVIHPDDRDALFATIFAAIGAKREELTYSYRSRHKEGHYVWREDRAKFSYDDCGLLQNTYVICRDITDRKKMFEDLVRAKERAEESDRLKSAFLANMSHEIRTPMNGILGFSALLKEQNLSGEEQIHHINIIEKSGIRMLNIINDIIDISKIESGQMEITLSETNVNEQTAYIYSFFKPEVEARGLRLYLQNTLPAAEVTIRTDREKMYAILTNLVKNAIKYTREGSIVFGYREAGKFLEFFVKDTGIGISPDRHEAIFERFVQADISDRQALQGAGLGLSITKAYVEMLGGSIRLVSEPGRGSTFYFTIPYRFDESSNPATENVSPGIPENLPARQLKILVAEDDIISYLLITRLLKSVGKEFIHVKTGAETVEACRNHPDIDLVLMDVKMPVMDGYEATRQIRKFNPEVIIFAQTAYSLSDDRDKALKAGCNDYISKPLRKEVLLSMISHYFGG